jgi:tetratricopeptide (TPR) repeat protein
MIRATLVSGLFLASLGIWGCATSDGAPPGVAESQQLVEDGREAVRQQNTAEAIRLYTRAVKANPDNAEAYYERGKCCVRVRLDPKTEVDSRVYEERALEDFSSRAQYKQAADDLLNAARFKPQDPEAHLCLGELYEAKFEDRAILAMDHYEKYVELGGTNPTIREKVKLWKELKKQMSGTGATPAVHPPAKQPTPEDEKRAAEIHLKALDLLKQPDKSEAVKAMEELLTQYGHTKYVQEKARALQAAIAAFKKKDAPK